MKLHTRLYSQFIRLSALIFVIAWSVSGCSGSNETAAGNPPSSDVQPSFNPASSEADINASNDNSDETDKPFPDDTQPSVDLVNSEASNNNDSNDSNNNNNNNNASNASPDTTATDLNTEIISNTIVTNEVDEAVNNNLVVADPLIQNRTLVSFDITVPYYLSDELRVELSWGDINIVAMWVGGQFWSASGEFPTETEHPLTITFFDSNGSVELARHSQSYRTSSNVSEPVQIQEEQFDANLFDNDGDGVNNLVELNAGTNPFVDEDSLLEIKGSYALSKYSSTFSRLSVPESFESRIPAERPYMGTFDRDPNWGVFGALVLADPSVDGVINIDADGNGTLTMQAGEMGTRFQRRFNGTRTHSENSIAWTAVRKSWSSDYYHQENVTNTVSVVDENVRTYAEVVTGKNTGTYEYTWEENTNLTGNLIEGSSLCKPVAGTSTITHWTVSVRGRYESIVSTEISKEIDDPYWRVVEVHNDVEYNDIETKEFFVRELIFQNRNTIVDSSSFICDFVDLK